MRVAVAGVGFEVAPRYESAKDLTCYSIERGVIVRCQNIPFPRFTPAEMSTALRSIGVDVLITGEVSNAVEFALSEAGIEVISGMQGKIRDIIDEYLSEAMMGFKAYA